MTPDEPKPQTQPTRDDSTTTLADGEPTATRIPVEPEVLNPWVRWIEAMSEEAPEIAILRARGLAERDAHQLRALVALAEVEAAPVGVPRVVPVARFAGQMTGLRPISSAIDFGLSKEFGRLQGRLQELWNHHHFHWLKSEVLPGLEGEAEAMVCAVLATSKSMKYASDRIGANGSSSGDELGRMTIGSGQVDEWHSPKESSKICHTIHPAP